MGNLADWPYWKVISITGQAGSGTDYQVELEIGDSAGGDFHLEGHCTNFPQDIRITDDDGTTLLDHFVEDLTADPIVVQVEVKDDLGSNRDIRVYYGKSGETTASDGDASFPFYDGFEDGDSSDAGDFIILGTNWAGTAHPHSGTYGLEVPTGQATQYSQAMGSLVFGSVVCGMWVYPQDITHRLGTMYIYDNIGQVSGIIKLDDGNLYGHDGSNWVDSGQGYSSGIQVKIEILCSGANEFYTRADNGSWAGPYNFTHSPSNINKIGFTSDDVVCYKDDFYVRKYNSPEPTFNNAGAEQTPGWTGIVLGVINPAKVIGIDVANIAKVMNV